MASQYNLNLKATLDTSQVQQELKKLRSAQMATYTDGSGPAGSSQMGLSHMQKIEVQLTKLNSAIAGLQRSIEQLGRVQGKPASGAQTSATGTTMPVAFSTSQKKAMNAWLASPEYRKFNKLTTRIVGGFDPEEIQALTYRYGSLKSANFAHNLMMSGGIPGFADTKYYKKQIQRWYNENEAGKQAFRQQRQAMRQSRQMAALLGGQLLGGAGSILEGMGYDNAGRHLSNLGEGVTAGGGAGLAATMAGIKGAGAIGAGVALATVITKNISSMEQLAEAVNKAAQAFEDNYKTLHGRTMGVHDTIMGIRQQDRADQLLESGNIAEARKQAKYWNDSANSAKQMLLGMEDPVEAEARIKRLAERRKEAADNALNGTNLEWARSALGESLFKIMGSPGAATRLQEVKNQIDEEAQNQISEMQQKYKDLEADMQRSKSYAGMYEDVVKQIEGAEQKSLQESNAEVAARVALSERNDQSIARYIAAGQANATQAFADGVIGNKLTGPLEKFNKLSEELDKLRNLKNNSLMQAYGVAKNIAENGSSMSSEDMKRELAKQGRLEQDAEYTDQRIGIIESALASIATSTVAPDLSHVTSLAQYGFNMGEKDDTVERMDKYYSRSLNLQEQIKNKLQEGVKTEARYSE